MIARIIAAYRIELIKAGHRTLTYFGPLVVLLAVACSVVASPLRRDAVSDYAFAAYATTLALNTLGLVLLLAFGAALVAPEIQSGTIRGVLVRPIRRSEYLLAKYLCAMTYALILLLSAAGSAWAILHLMGDALGVTVGGELLFSGTEMRNSFALAGAISLLPLWASAAYALCISCCTRSSASAITIAIGLWFLFDFVKYQANLAPLWFSTYLDAPWDLFSRPAEGMQGDAWAVLVPTAATAIPAIVFFLAAGALTLRARSFTR